MTARIAAGIAAAVSLVLTLVLTVAFFNGYWRNRDCFDDRGRCFVPEDGSVFSANSIYLAPLAVIFGILFVIGSLFAGRR
ncbi:hypothetical protein HKCCSP123_12570 [Rhodobacterales bacterium HKCCSP123]|nr:hypothetical protein [Rhodobacterales bacterium HKCCSP123]